MQDFFDDLVNELKKMNRNGPLRCSYYVERNYQMSVKIMRLVQEYNVVAWLVGDELKRDQFKFIYEIHDKIFNSALKDIYLNNKSSMATIQSVIPELTVF